MKTIHVSIVTPSGSIFEADADHVNTRTTAGEIGIYPEHIPLIAPLEITMVEVSTASGIERLAVNSGFLEVQPDSVTIISQAAEKAESIDLARAQASKRRAEERLTQKDVDVERAELALQRALNRIHVYQIQ